MPKLLYNIIRKMRRKKEQSISQSQLLALEFQKSHRVNTSRSSKSPQLHQVKMINKYLKVNRPLFNEAQKEIIEKKLDLQKQAELQAEKRIKRNECFVKFRYNPIYDKENIRGNRSNRQLLKQKSVLRLDKSHQQLQSDMSLIDAMRRQKKLHLSKHTNSLHHIQGTSSEISLAVNRCLKDEHYTLHRRPAPKAVQEVKQRQLSFQEIVMLPDKNYYAERQKDINIFEVMTGNSKNIVTKDILFRYHFNFTHCVDKLQAFKVPIFRDLSRLGRCLVFNTKISRSERLDILVSGQLSFNGNDIRYNDIINVASGRLDHTLVYSVLNDKNTQNDGSPNSSIIDDDQPIAYQDYQRQYSMNIKNQKNFKQENEEYLNFMISPSQERQRKRYHKFYENIEENLKVIKKSYEMTIQDRKLHENYHALIANDLSFLVDFGKKGKRNPIEADKLVRANKKRKSRHQRLKIKEVLSTMQMKNDYQEKLKSFIVVQKRK